MDKFLRLTDKKSAQQARGGKARIHRSVTTERIEKLKRSFQPFWMRELIPCKKVWHLLMLTSGLFRTLKAGA